MKFITKRMREKDEDDLVVNDWKFAAMVIDRFEYVYALFCIKKQNITKQTNAIISWICNKKPT